MAAELAKETIFGAAFREFLARGDEGDDLRRLRTEALEVFAENGFPTLRDEDWKYTNVSTVAARQWSVTGGQRTLAEDDA
ncbi:MAG: hypothetical protein H0V76_01980, partial [Blastocatellia bacterium]|nr:hypothetical protein [Blastocatellia bacterium]